MTPEPNYELLSFASYVHQGAVWCGVCGAGSSAGCRRAGTGDWGAAGRTLQDQGAHSIGCPLPPVCPPDDGSTLLLDDALLIEKYMTEFDRSPLLGGGAHYSTSGALSVHINSNRDANAQLHDHWVDFAVHWWVCHVRWGGVAALREGVVLCCLD